MTGSGENSGSPPGSPSHRARVRVKTARGRPPGSKLWLERQLNDPYVSAAKTAGYRSRAAWKLTELDDKYHLLRPGARSEEHTSELQSLMRISYAVFCLNKKNTQL